MKCLLDSDLSYLSDSSVADDVAFLCSRTKRKEQVRAQQNKRIFSSEGLMCKEVEGKGFGRKSGKKLL